MEKGRVLISSAKDIANTINTNFISVAQDIPPLDHNSLPAYLPSITPHMTVSPHEVYNKLNRINTSKSGGPDCIPPRIVKEFAYELSFPIYDIFNCSLRDGILPNIWKTAYVTPVPNTSPPNLENLRPIALTCLFSKIFEDFVVSWIMEDIEKCIDSHRFGSLKGLSTTRYLVKLLDDIHKQLDKPQHSSVLVTTDFSKAFDRISHQIVVEKFIRLDKTISISPA